MPTGQLNRAMPSDLAPAPHGSPEMRPPTTASRLSSATVSTERGSTDRVQETALPPITLDGTQQERYQIFIRGVLNNHHEVLLGDVLIPGRNRVVIEPTVQIEFRETIEVRPGSIHDSRTLEVMQREAKVLSTPPGTLGSSSAPGVLRP